MCDPINCIIMSAKVQNKKHFLSLKSSVIADENSAENNLMHRDVLIIKTGAPDGSFFLNLSKMAQNMSRCKEKPSFTKLLYKYYF